MFWETAWALVLGFGLSGAVQAFVSRRAMQAKLGDHRPPSIARASGYGTVSSSCAVCRSSGTMHPRRTASKVNGSSSAPTAALSASPPSSATSRPQRAGQRHPNRWSDTREDNGA